MKNTVRVKSVRIDASSSNIPTTYDATSASKVLSISTMDGYRHLKIMSELGDRIALTMTDEDSGVPASTSANDNQIYVPDTSVEFRDDITTYENFFIRSDSGSAITTGILVLEVW